MINDIVLVILLSIIQGLTEFLPISSSAHLLLPNLLFGTKDLGLGFDIATHAGTLIAVIFYFKCIFTRFYKGWHIYSYRYILF